MKLSIVTISFNQCDFLKRCMDSVLTQRTDLEKIGVELEYIVVDPGSKDGSRELIESYGDQVVKVFEKDDGPADGLNKGFALATGDIYGYLNSDDVYLPGKLSEAMSFFSKSNSVDVIYGNSYIADGNGIAIKRFSSNSFDLKRFAMGGVVICQQSTFFKSDAFKSVSGFNAENHTSWDAELVVDMALAGAVVKWVNKYWAIFSIYDGTITGSQRMAELSEKNRARIFQKIMGRDMLPSDKWKKLLVRVQKWILNPVSLCVPVCCRLRVEKYFIPDLEIRIKKD